MRQNGGGILVRSRRGTGATFSIYLPQLRERVAPANPEPAPSPVRRGTETILLVEDESALRTMLRQSLAAAGYRVLEAGDGADAVIAGPGELDIIHGPAAALLTACLC